jgi:hypothetical protein
MSAHFPKLADPSDLLTYPALVLRDGPMAYWRLGEAAGSGTVADSSGNGRTGTVVGGVTLGQAGPLADGNGAASCDGTGYVVIADASWFPAAAGSLEMWVYPNQPVTDAWSQKPFFGVRSAGDVVAFYLALGGTNNYFPGLWTGGTWIANGAGPPFPTRPSVFQAWQHVVIVWANGAKPTVYINGQAGLVGNADYVSFTPTSLAMATEANLGRKSKVVLDEIAIYPVALTLPQLAAHYAARLWTTMATARAALAPIAHPAALVANPHPAVLVGG